MQSFVFIYKHYLEKGSGSGPEERSPLSEISQFVQVGFAELFLILCLSSAFWFSICSRQRPSAFGVHGGSVIPCLSQRASCFNLTSPLSL